MGVSPRVTLAVHMRLLCWWAACFHVRSTYLLLFNADGDKAEKVIITIEWGGYMVLMSNPDTAMATLCHMLATSYARPAK